VDDLDEQFVEHTFGAERCGCQDSSINNVTTKITSITLFSLNNPLAKIEWLKTALDSPIFLSVTTMKIGVLEIDRGDSAQ
jgi:hypothetical protein